MRLALLVSIFLILVSCHKDKDSDLAELWILYPAMNSFYFSDDTVLVVAEVISEAEITKYSVQLYDNNFIPSGPAIRSEVSLPVFEIREPYPLIAGFQKPGEYHIKVVVNTPTASSTRWRSIFISNVPLKLESVIAFTRNAQHTSIHALDFPPLSSFVHILDRPADVVYSAVSNKPSLIFLSGSYFEALEGVGLSEGNTLWSVPAIHNPPEPYFTGLHLIDDYLYSLRYDGSVQVYRHSGVLYKTLMLSSLHIPYKFHKSGDKYFVLRRQRAGYNWSLAVYHTSSGYLLQANNPGITPLSILDGPGTDLFLVGNRNGNGCIMVYEIADNHLWEPANFTFGRIISVTSPAKGQLLIASETGIFWYRYANNSLTLFSPLIAQHLEYDVQGSTLYAASANAIHQISFPLANQSNTLPLLPDSVIRFHLKYNW